MIDTWYWLTNVLHYSLVVGDTPANRAVNAFSFQFNAENYEDLFYCLLGIEALYNTSTSDGIMEQIRNKTAFLFGEPIEYKKRISQMYSIRSEFIHGHLNFPNKYYTYDAADEFTKFYDTKYVNALSTAQSILVASIRLLIQNKAKGFKTKIIVDFDL